MTTPTVAEAIEAFGKAVYAGQQEGADRAEAALLSAIAADRAALVEALRGMMVRCIAVDVQGLVFPNEIAAARAALAAETTAQPKGDT